jgi:hypothetical protein
MKRMGENNSYTKTFKKSILPADLIDRTAIVTVNRLGFTVFIFTKGNLHEHRRILSNGILLLVFFFFCSMNFF